MLSCRRFCATLKMKSRSEDEMNPKKRPSATSQTSQSKKHNIISMPGSMPVLSDTEPSNSKLTEHVTIATPELTPEPSATAPSNSKNELPKQSSYKSSVLDLRPLSNVSSRNLSRGKRRTFLAFGLLTLIGTVVAFIVVVLSLLQVDGYIPKIWVIEITITAMTGKTVQGGFTVDRDKLILGNTCLGNISIRVLMGVCIFLSTLGSFVYFILWHMKKKVQ